MKEYKYIRLDLDNDPSVEDVLHEIKGSAWSDFKSSWSCLSGVAEDILRENYINWNIYEEDDGVCLAIREADCEDFEVFWVTPSYIFSAESDFIFDKDDFKKAKINDEEAKDETL